MRSFPEPCMCGALDCKSCHPGSYWMPEYMDRLNDLAVDAGAKFAEAEREGYRCELTAEPTRDGITWRLVVSGDIDANSVDSPADVDEWALNDLEDLIHRLRHPEQYFQPLPRSRSLVGLAAYLEAK